MENPRYVREPHSPGYVRFTYETRGSRFYGTAPRTVQANTAIRERFVTMSDLPITDK